MTRQELIDITMVVLMKCEAYSRLVGQASVQKMIEAGSLDLVSLKDWQLKRLIAWADGKLKEPPPEIVEYCEKLGVPVQ